MIIDAPEMTQLVRTLRKVSFDLPQDHPLQSAIVALHSAIMKARGEASKCA